MRAGQLKALTTSSQSCFRHFPTTTGASRGGNRYAVPLLSSRGSPGVNDAICESQDVRDRVLDIKDVTPFPPFPFPLRNRGLPLYADRGERAPLG